MILAAYFAGLLTTPLAALLLGFATWPQRRSPVPLDPKERPGTMIRSDAPTDR